MNVSAVAAHRSVKERGCNIVSRHSSLLLDSVPYKLGKNLNLFLRAYKKKGIESCQLYTVVIDVELFLPH